MILTSNCRHGSEIAVYAGVRHGRPFLRKAASTPDGIADLRREWSGWQWYTSRYSYLQALPTAEQWERPSYLRIDFPWIPGKKGDYQAGILRNQARIQAALNHYAQIWPKERAAPMHGDFSIDNLLFEKERLVIVDWEHFTMDSAPWGFDALHLIFETLWYDLKAGHALSPIQKIIGPWITQLKRQALWDVEWGKAPLAHLCAWMIQNKSRWGAQIIRFPDKFPILRYSQQQIAAIDALHE